MAVAGINHVLTQKPSNFVCNVSLLSVHAAAETTKYCNCISEAVFKKFSKNIKLIISDMAEICVEGDGQC